MNTIKSQIANMNEVTVKAFEPKSQLGAYIQGDVKGKEFKLAFLQSLIFHAVQEAHKNNAVALDEARSFAASGTTQKYVIYAAGLVAIGDVAVMTYPGRWTDTANTPIREKANLSAQGAVERFSAAFAASAAGIKAKAKEASDAKKAAKLANAALVAGVTEAEGEVVAEGVTEGVTVADYESVEVDSSVLVDTVCDALSGGMLSADDVLSIRAALAQFDLMNEQTEELLAA